MNTDEEKPVRKLSDMETVLAAIAQWDYTQVRDPLYEFSMFLREAMASGSELPQIETRLIRMLGPRSSLDGRDFVCRQLSLIGTAASVLPLAGMLDDPATFGMARYALERIPPPEAIDALRGALPKSSGRAQASIVASLGQRRDARSVPALRDLAIEPDEVVSGAALAALASIGNAAALAAIGQVRSRLNAGRREEGSRVYVRCADLVAVGGDPAAARRVYQQLNSADEAPMIRIAALTGITATDGTAAVPVLSKELASTNSDIQAAAIGLLNRIPGSEITALLVRQYPALAPVGQIRVLAALGERGDAGARPLAMQAVKSPTPEVRTAALGALGNLGDASAVPLLAEAAANTQDDEREAARVSLGRLRGAGVDAAIVAAIGSHTGKVQLELIQAAGERPVPSAADVLMQVARGSDRAAARESLRALRNVAGPAQVPPLLDLVTSLQDAAERRETAVTLANVIQRAPRPDIAGVLAAYQTARSQPIKLTLIDIMGQVSANQALPVLRANLKDADQETARAAILALTAWRTPDPLPDLLALAKGDTNATRQILALRGVIRLLSVTSDRSPEQTVALLSEAWQLARQPAERRSILALLPSYATPGALRLAEAAVNDATVTSEAKAAVESLRLLGIR